MASNNDDVEEELSAIESILMGGLDIERVASRPSRVKVQCSPLVASEEDRSYVGLTLVVNITPEYPMQTPTIEIKNPRGLDEVDVEKLVRDLNDKCAQYIGGPVIFELIDLCQEFLTERNVPACPCVICLRHILSDDDFVKTVCFHYFHSICFGRYVQNVYDTPQEDKSKSDVMTCPVCRGILPNVERSEIDRMLAMNPPVLEAEESDFCLTRELKALQERMSRLFIKQKEAGGIIDIEADSKKFLIITNPGTEGVEPVTTSVDESSFGQAASGIQRPTAQAPESSKKHKGGSGMGKRRDYGERKRNTRRRN